MYTLRIVEETREDENSPFNDQVIENFEVGTAYSVLKNGGTKEFDQIMEKYYPEEDKTNICAIICCECEKDRFFFVKKDTKTEIFSYFIMTDCGKTFERL